MRRSRAWPLSVSHQRLTFQPLSPNVRMLQSQGWAPGGLCLGTEGDVWACMCSVQAQWEGSTSTSPSCSQAFRAGRIRQISPLSSVFILEAAAHRCPFPSSGPGGELAWLKPSCFCMTVRSCHIDLGSRMPRSFSV